MKFTFRTDNRKIQRQHVNEIKESIQAHGYLSHAPIVLNEEGEIIDGQHRYIACCELGITPPTVTVTSNDTKLMVDLNRSQKAWSIDDFINFYAKAGKWSYKVLQEFCKYAKLATTPALIILLGSFRSFESIRTGELMFEMDATELQKKYAIADDIGRIARLFGLRRGNKTMTEAYVTLVGVEGFDREYFLQKMQRYRDRLSLCASSKSYLQLFVSIYNYRNKSGELAL